MTGATRQGLTAAIVSAVVWALHFTAIYVINALACARGIGAGYVPLSIAVASVPAFLAVLYLTALSWPHARPGEEESEPFLNRLGLLLSTLTLLALTWNVLTLLLVPACGQDG
jgi:hypothetical protein